MSFETARERVRSILRRDVIFRHVKLSFSNTQVCRPRSLFIYFFCRLIFFPTHRLLSFRYMSFPCFTNPFIIDLFKPLFFSATLGFDVYLLVKVAFSTCGYYSVATYPSRAFLTPTPASSNLTFTLLRLRVFAYKYFNTGLACIHFLPSCCPEYCLMLYFSFP